MSRDDAIGFLAFFWILCWFVAIWMFHFQFFLMGLFFFSLAGLLVSVDEKEKKKMNYCPKCGNKLEKQ